jgi:REP-associated tyrosine transposase
MWITDPNTGRTLAKKCRRRFDVENTPRELTFSCYRGYPFLARERTCQWLVDAVEDARQKWPIDLWAWVIMPEHVHLVLAPRKSLLKIGTFQGFVKERVARQAIRWLEQNASDWIPRITVREGSRTRRRFWQPGGGYDRNIESVDTLESMIDYIHLNPVRRGLVEKPVDWPWSSARWYAGIRPAILAIDETLPA